MHEKYSRPGSDQSRVEYAHPSLERTFWKGTDIAVAQTAIIPPRRPGLVIVTIDPSNFVSTDPVLIARHEATTRSGLAMRGGDVPDFGKQVVRFAEVNGVEIGDEPFDAQIVLHNYSERELIIPSEQRIARPFFAGLESTIEGEELVSLIKSGKINLGEEGKDKDFVYRKHNGVETGFFVKISEENRRWTGSGTGSIVYTKSEDAGDRSRVDKLLTPVPMELSRPVLWVGDTQAKIILCPEVDAVLHAAVVSTANGKPQVTGAHINSHVLDGERTGWIVRMEILSSTIKERMPTHAYMTVVRKALPTAA